MKNHKIIPYVILMFLLVNAVNAEKYFVLDVNYIIGSLTFNSISLREIDRTIKYNDNSGFLVKTVAFDNSDITKIYYNMSENRNYLVYLPYNKNAAKIVVYNPKNSIVMDIDVSSFADTCGNGICELYESYESCTKDCKSGSKDDFCDGVEDGICDPDCSPKTDADCMPNQGNQNITSTKTSVEGKKPQGEIKPAEEGTQVKQNYLIWILAALAILILIVLFLFIKKRKDSQIISSLKEYINENIRRGFTLQQIKDVLFREGYNEKEVDKAIKSI